MRASHLLRPYLKGGISGLERHCLRYGRDYRMLLHVCSNSYCTNKRHYNGRQNPLCVGQSVATQLSWGINMSLQHINANHAQVHEVGHFCTVAVVTISSGWSKTCSEAQLFMMPVACLVLLICSFERVCVCIYSFFTCSPIDRWSVNKSCCFYFQNLSKIQLLSPASLKLRSFLLALKPYVI